MSESSTRKIGEGHGGAWMRQGLRELRGALYPQSNVAQAPEYGLYGTMTPGEIAEARRPDAEPSLEEEPRQSSALDRSMSQAESHGQDRSSRGIDIERN